MVICANCKRPIPEGQRAAPCPHCGHSHYMIFDADQGSTADVDRAAIELAQRHYELESGLTQIFRITDQAEASVVRAAPIKLLEVNENTVESGIMPLHFGPAPASGIPYSSIIVEVTPDEFEKIRSHELKLPEGWEIGEELPRLASH